MPVGRTLAATKKLNLDPDTNIAKQRLEIEKEKVYGTGNGEGKTSGGGHPVSPWGLPAKGLKTRKKKKLSSKFIVKKRK